MTPEVNCNKTGMPQKKCIICIDAAVEAECPDTFPAAGEGLSESVLDLCLSQYAGADCRSAEPLQKAPVFGESVAGGEAGVMDLDCLFDGLSHPMEPLRGDAQAELSPGVEAVVAGT